jgi:glycosyltransferase involved in cell wall biosynthesis
MNMPLVSILMPAYNSERFIGEAIDSILNQSYTNFELIIFDDGSSDGTRKVIESYNDSRIVKVLSDKNFGVVKARNEIIDRAKGKYISLMDADDIADATRLETQIEVLEAGDCDICGSAQWVLDETSARIKKSKDKFTDADLRALLSVYCSLCNSTITGKAEIFKRFKYDITLLTAEDYFLWVRIAAAGFRFINLKDRLVTYRCHPAQTSVTYLEKFRLTTAEVQKKYLELLGIPEKFFPEQQGWSTRLSNGVGLLTALNQRFSGISFKANCEIYARFQYRRNGFWTPLTRLEKYCVAAWVGLLPNA